MVLQNFVKGEMLMRFYEAKSNIFTSWFYPLVVAALVLVGSLTGLEVYTAFINVLLVSIALWVSNTIKPFLFTAVKQLLQ